MSVVEVPFKGEGPMPLLREIPAGEPYPVDALGPLQGIAEAVNDITQAPVAIAAQSALSVASLAVQAFADVETLGADAPCSLFCITIAESGERKSGCDRLLMKGIRDHERDLGEIYADEIKAYNIAFKIWSEKQKRLIAETAGANKEKAALASLELEDLGPEPKAPLTPQLTAMDPTFEGLLKLYHTGHPSLGLFTDEGGGFLGGHAMNSDNRLKTMAGLSQLWNGEAINRIRVGDGVSVYHGRRLASHLMAQPVAAHQLLGDPLASGQGFLARFLISEPPSHIGFRLSRGSSPASRLTVDVFANRVRQVLATAPTDTGNPQELSPRRLPLSSPAKDLLWRFYEEVEKGQAPGKEFENARAHASKSAEQAARIAGVLTLWQDLDAADVTPEAMISGVTLANYFLSEAKGLADVGAISLETAKAEALRKWLVDSWRHPEVVTKDILQYGPSHMRESALAKAAMKTLEKHGWLVKLPEGAVIRGQARKEAYRIVGKTMRFDAAAVMAEILSQENTPATSATLLPEPEKRGQDDEKIEKSEAEKTQELATRLATFATRRTAPAHPNPVRAIMERLEGDMERYAEALRAYGPMSYGQAMQVLGWGGTRAGQAESDLRAAGRIAFNQLGRAYLVDGESGHDQ